MLNVVRIIPVTIVAALILLGVKVGDVWSGVTDALTAAPSAPQVTAAAADATGARKMAIAENVAGDISAAPPSADDKAARRFALSAAANAEEPAAAGGQGRKAVIAGAQAAENGEAGAGEAANGADVPAAPTAQGGAVSGTLGEGGPSGAGEGRGSSSPSEFSQAEIELLQNLSRRRDELDSRERQIEMRENLMAATEKRIEERIGELRRIESQIDSLLIKYDEQRQRQIDSLVKIYQNMKPKDAARIFERLDMNVLLEVAENMKSRSLAPILAEMDANRAQKITVELATRRQLPGTN